MAVCPEVWRLRRIETTACCGPVLGAPHSIANLITAALVDRGGDHQAGSFRRHILVGDFQTAAEMFELQRGTALDAGKHWSLHIAIGPCITVFERNLQRAALFERIVLISFR